MHAPQSTRSQIKRSHCPDTLVPLARLAVMAVLVVVTGAGCSLGTILVGDPTPTPTPVPPTPLATWTPLPEDVIRPAEAATLTVIAGLAAWPTLTPTDTPIATDTPTATATALVPPTDTPTSAPTAVPTPFVTVQGEIVNVRTGPGVNYPIAAQVRQGETYTALGTDQSGTWWKICCVNGSEVWIYGQLVSTGGSTDELAVVAAPPPPPPPAPTSTPLPTDTPQPYRPFDIGDGPHYFSSTNPWLTIWIKAFTGKPPIFLPVEGYRLRVFRNDQDVSSSETTKGVFELSAPLLPDEPNAFGARRQYNLKYEYLPTAGDAEWRIYMTDGSGRQLSPEVTFRTEPDGLLREVYVGFFDLRGYQP